MATFIPILMLFIGLGLGALGAYLLLRAKETAAYDRGKHESQAQIAGLQATLDARDGVVLEMKGRLETLDAQFKELQRHAGEYRERLSAYQTTLEQERKQSQEKLELVNDAQRKLADAFKALAAEALNSNNKSFLDLAKTHLEKFQESAQGDLAKRQLAIDTLVKPVSESLKKVDEKLGELEKHRIEAYQEVKTQIKQLNDTHKDLSTQTSKLVQALRAPNVRGRWGEIQLRRVVELAGMSNYCDFSEQQTVEGEEGRLRPDLTVRLPSQKTIVIDAKAPLNSFLDAIEAHDETARKEMYVKHARSVRNHVTALGKKAYFEQYGSPEFVVLFLPGEVFFSAALEHDPTLIEVGVESNVIIATPTTLIALLRAVAYGWRQEQLADNAREISELGKLLYKRLSTMGDQLAKVGKQLASATDAYNKAIGSLEARVMVTARKLDELGVVAEGTQIEPLVPIEQIPRAIQAIELLTNGDGSAIVESEEATK